MKIEEKLGKKIREIRISKGWTLADLSKQAKLSISMVSKIENARVSSPVAVYANIAAALNLNLGELFSSDAHVPLSLVRKNEWKTVTKVPNYIGKALAFKKSGKKMEPFINVYHPNISKPPRYSHESEEFIFVLKGRLEFSYGDDKFILNEGDCVYYDARIDHSTIALDGKEARALVAQA
ncbi:MAG TPA: XRE family transcriptional regulator [Syntrophobacteria bacterium]|nr:XRE family transcriptional regulator [Syntrophobacteria bacterium]